ncbi:hypothetical protein ACS0TY_019389 [Phlomoides rotata]
MLSRKSSLHPSMLLKLPMRRARTTFLLESYSTYVVQILKSSHPEVPWRLLARWHHVRGFREEMQIVVSHIYRKGNEVADRLTREEVHSFRWWSEPP